MKYRAHPLGPYARSGGDQLSAQKGGRSWVETGKDYPPRIVRLMKWAKIVGLNPAELAI